MIEHCVSAFEEEQEQNQYRAYITDALMLLTENTARSVENGKYLTSRWVKNLIKEDTRSGDEIVIDIIKNAGITFKGGEQ